MPPSALRRTRCFRRCACYLVKGGYRARPNHARADCMIVVRRTAYEWREGG